MDRPTANAVTTRIGNDDLAVAAEHRAEQHERRAQTLGRFERDELPIQLSRVNLQLVVADPASIDAQIAQHLEDVLDVGNARRVTDRARLIAQHRGCHQLQDGVFGARDGQRAAQLDATFDLVRGRLGQAGLTIIAAGLSLGHT